MFANLILLQYCVHVLQLFICTTGCSLTDLVSTDVVGQLADRRFVNTLTIPSGMVCQSRTTAQSQALYICGDEDGAATRMCQSYWTWNGSIPQCSPDPGRKDGKCFFACSYIFLRNQVLSTNIVHTVLKFLSLACFIRRQRSLVLRYNILQHQDNELKPGWKPSRAS